MSDRKNGKKTGRTENGQFAPGNSGRPKGARHRTTLAIESLLEGESEALTRKCIEAALDGDMTAMRICMERIAPAKKDAPVTFDMPEMKSAADAAAAVGALLDNVASGCLSPEEARAIAPLIETYRKTLETEDLERRISALESSK